jgi:hypothetical protein
MKKMDTQYLTPKETMINVTNEPSDTTKNPSKRKSWKRSLRNAWRRYRTQLTGKYKMHLRNFQDTTNKELEKTQKTTK